MIYLFFLIGAITVCATAAAMSLRQPVHCVLALAVGLIGIACTYLLLGAQFVGLTQVMVYVGAVAILAVFAIMTTQKGGDAENIASERTTWWKAVSGILTAGGVFALLVKVIVSANFSGGLGVSPNPSVSQIGIALMNGYALPLEVIGLSLTVALVGAVIVAMPEMRRRS